jgi:wyosine [tRNA(Phe)-imidazoG37] synthetase (radical SAM superfamily)
MHDGPFASCQQGKCMTEIQETIVAPRACGVRVENLTPFEWPRNALGHRYVYAVISPRARGLSLGVNLNPGKYCNFDCIYCEVDRIGTRPMNVPVNVEAMSLELEEMLLAIDSGLAERYPVFRGLPNELLQLRHVALSGDGEPTLCPNFDEVLETVIHLRASSRVPPFKIVVITNASGLDRPEVIYGIDLLTPRDEIWAKLDGGTQEYFDFLNRPEVPFTQILENIRNLGRRRPVVIQTMVPALDGENPFEIGEYIARLRELKEAGADISLVQIYSANRPTPHSECSHLSLRELSGIAKAVRAGTGLRTEVF